MKEKIIKIRKSKYIDYLFLIGIGILTFIMGYGGSSLFHFIKDIKTILRIIVFVCLLPKALFQEYSKKDIPMIAMVCLLTILCIYFNNEKNTIIIPMV